MTVPELDPGWRVAGQLQGIVIVTNGRGSMNENGLDARITSYRMALEDAITDLLDAGEDELELSELVESTVQNWKLDNAKAGE